MPLSLRELHDRIVHWAPAATPPPAPRIKTADRVCSGCGKPVCVGCAGSVALVRPQEYVAKRANALLDEARRRVDQDPTDGQKEVGNYRKGHFFWNGLDLTIENPQNSYRSGTAEDGTKWKSRIHHDYGYIKRSEGADGDQIDVFLGPDLGSEIVFIVDQINPSTGEFDEVKCMLAFRNKAAAKDGYLKNYEKGWKGLGDITAATLEQFRVWLADGNTKKSFKEYAKKKWEKNSGLATGQPHWQTSLSRQLRYPLWNSQQGLGPNVLANLSAAAENTERRVSEQDELEDIRSALEPGYRLRRFRNFMQHGDRVTDPVDRLLSGRVRF